MKIPYGRSSFEMIRSMGMFYADKTPFLPQLESAEDGYAYLLFLRPRRFGKSTLLSMLEHYYDLSKKARYDELFRGLWIHEHPTPEQGQYLVLTLDFSPVTTEGDEKAILRSFTSVVKNCLQEFLMRYESRFPPLARFAGELTEYEDLADLIGALLSIVGGLGQRLYLLVDEYDHFANRLLSDGQEALHEAVVRGTGFVRSFYAALKAWTSRGALGRMFVTGVSPIMLDDLSSGFNIITHISQHPRFNALAGFTRADVERAVDEYLSDKADLQKDPRIGDRDKLLGTLEQHYNGYRFSKRAAESIYNSDLVLYFLRQIQNTGQYPEQMLDLNVRTDYGRLQRIATVSGASGATTRSLLETILTGDQIESQLVEQFGVQSMYRREQLISLFYYMGMLTFLPQPEGTAIPRLAVPNRVIRELQWEYLGIAMARGQELWIDTQRMEKALESMAIQGDIDPLLSLFREQVLAAIGVKDQRQFNEGTLKLMLVAYIIQSPTFHILSEKEFARGYCDLFLALTEKVSAGQYAWMLEVKHLKTQAKAAEIEKVVAKAYEQLERYASDKTLVELLTRGRHLKAGALIFVGAKEVLFRPWPPAQLTAKKTAKTATRARKAPAKKR